MTLAVNYNPDVLSCLANLSSDEVFTPPGLANQMLDLLPTDLWKNKNAKFLDPFCKTGVFLREITRRLNEGLKEQMPDDQARVNHILTRQVYGMAITELTALISRRSVYCSKWANGKKSICTAFENEEGNIVHPRFNHQWVRGRCAHCGASQQVLGREEGLEAHAYALIHMDDDDIRKGCEMKFDVIIGNPPYQINDGGAQASASPLYHLFVMQAKKLNPRYLSMIIPARWYSGGKGLDQFRDEMLSDRRLVRLVDFIDSTECFPGVDLSGGNCYFLWERDKEDDCFITNVVHSKATDLKRPLLIEGTKTFIRFNQSISVIEKVKKFGEKSFSDFVSSRKPFGLTTTSIGSDTKTKNSVTLISNNGEVSYFLRKNVATNADLIDKYKVYISYAYGERGGFPYLVLGKPFLGAKGTCCTETYLLIGPFESEDESKNVMSYIRTRFFRFMVLLKKNTQHATQKVYEFVPVQDFSRSWTDEDLYKKYKLTKAEIEFIESMVRPMQGESEEVDDD